MNILMRIFSAVLMGVAVWTCTKSEPDKPDTLTLTLNDSLKAAGLKYDSIKIDLYTVKGVDSVYAKTLFHGPYTDAAQLTDLELGFLADGNFSLKLIAFRDGIKVLELRLEFSSGDPSPASVVTITPPDTPKVIITWPLNGHVTNQDSIVIQWGVDSANTGLVMQPPRTFHLDEGEMPLTLLDTNGRGIVGQAIIHVTRVSGTLFVNASALNNGDGNSWATAYRNLQTALARATTGWDIWVAKGIYRPFEGSGLDSSDDTSFVMKDNVDMIGGFVGTENAVGLRNRLLNETVLSGERGDTAISYDNAGPVLLGASSAILDGFVVEKGYAASGYGAGMVNIGVSPEVRNCTFRHNIFFANSGGGGAVYNQNGTPAFVSCLFVENQTSQMGGGIFNSNASPIISSSVFRLNSATIAGGAIANAGSSSLTVNSTVFRRNTGNDGGAVWNGNASSSIINSFFLENSAVAGGGGVFSTSTITTIINSVFAANIAVRGGGLMTSLSALSSTNCVFSGNYATDTGGGVFYRSPVALAGKSAFRNSIFMGNYSGMDVGNQLRVSSDSGSLDTLEIGYSDLSGGVAAVSRSGNTFLITGLGILDQNPLFLNSLDAIGPDGAYFTADDGFNLSVGSPCINAGDPNPQGLPLNDITGASRVSGAQVDMGAYEQ